MKIKKCIFGKLNVDGDFYRDLLYIYLIIDLYNKHICIYTPCFKISICVCMNCFIL